MEPCIANAGLCEVRGQHALNGSHVSKRGWRAHGNAKPGEGDGEDSCKPGSVRGKKKDSILNKTCPARRNKAVLNSDPGAAGTK